MKVKAAPGVRVPKQGAPRKYILDTDEIEVDETVYYLRRVRDGDLIRIETSSTNTPAPAPIAAQAPTAAAASLASTASNPLLSPSASAMPQS